MKKVLDYENNSDKDIIHKKNAMTKPMFEYNFGPNLFYNEDNIRINYCIKEMAFVSIFLLLMGIAVSLSEGIWFIIPFFIFWYLIFFSFKIKALLIKFFMDHLTIIYPFKKTKIYYKDIIDFKFENIRPSNMGYGKIIHKHFKKPEVVKFNFTNRITFIDYQLPDNDLNSRLYTKKDFIKNFENFLKNVTPKD